MNDFDDSSLEMHDEWFDPDATEQLLDGEIPSPEFADLAAMVSDVRSLSSATPTPEVRGALAEFIGVGLTATEAPAEPSASAAVSESIDLTTATQPRRKSVIAEVVTFAGTLSGKLLLGGAVAAASVTGAQATGVVDLPGLPDKPAAVVVADDPAPAELPLEDTEEKVEPVEEEKTEEVEPVDEDKTEEVEPVEEEKTEEKAEPVEEEKTEEKAEPVEEKKTEEKAEPVEEKKTEEKKTDEKADTSDKDAAILELQIQLTKDKEVVYAEFGAQIQALELEKKPLVQALDARLGELEKARNDAKAPLYAELETTTDEQRKAEIEAELGAIFQQWEQDRDAAIADASPAINAIKEQIKAVELARDAEIDRLFEEYHAAVAAL